MDLKNLDDEQLISRFYQADEEALQVVFKRHKEALFNFVLRMTSNRADAEDALSHTFMMICEKRYTVKEGASFKTWAYTVARNTCLSQIRHKNKFYSLWFPNKESQEEGFMDVADPTTNVRDQLSQNESMAMVQKGLRKLPQEQKEALLLREYQGFSYQEIAQILGCSLDKVKILIFRARQQLKDLLPPVLLEEGS